MAKPVSGDWIEDEFKGLAMLGVTTLASMLEIGEAAELGLAEEGRYCRDNNINFMQHSIVDRSVPQSVKSFKLMVVDIVQRFKAGEGVVIHCRAGIGRSGMVAIAVLSEYGFSIDDAMTTVSQARGIPVPDTEAQINWLYDHFEEYS